MSDIPREPTGGDGATKIRREEGRRASGIENFTRWGYAYGAAAGFSLWLLSRWAVGQDEPWDGPWWYYSLTLKILGVTAGMVSRQFLVAALIGEFLSQEICVIYQSVSESSRRGFGGFSGAAISWIGFGTICLLVFLIVPLFLGYGAWLTRKLSVYLVRRSRNRSSASSPRI